MQTGKKEGKCAKWISGLAVAAAVGLLLQTCRICRPFGNVIAWEAWEQSRERMKEAFSVLCDGLGNGESVVEAFSESYREWNGVQTD